MEIGTAEASQVRGSRQRSQAVHHYMLAEGPSEGAEGGSNVGPGAEGGRNRWATQCREETFAATKHLSRKYRQCFELSARLGSVHDIMTIASKMARIHRDRGNDRRTLVRRAQVLRVDQFEKERTKKKPRHCSPVVTEVDAVQKPDSQGGQ